MAGTTDTGGRRRAPIAAINVTPLVDVMLVLLVIMMVSATYIVSQTLKVELPKTATSDGKTATVAAVTITDSHQLYLNKQPVSEDELTARLRVLHAEDRGMTLVVSADEKADHGVVVHVLDLARVEGITSFAVNVERKKP
ncbi:biopolymer transporter ExbD [Nannocystis sp. SCPEA4]|uniref:ExbD/TolR family protein n=1 Tax=Nannocystis sp. SCPEA4 TaxID=2996787 RepID=UPI00226FF7EB|nr:biopolymer transporter ExbD [Nannocystis sp. SCPEA4]MCY1059639.1 biopolymer transporter ExbD [Nannocystis sp. SCPEA4]